MNHRSDSLLTKLGERKNRAGWRLWVEDNGFRRLARNGFAPSTAFEAVRRPGVGLVLNATTLASCHISSRRSESLLSYEASDLQKFLAPEVRVRIHYKQIVVSPSLRTHFIARPATQVWKISGMMLETHRGVSPNIA